MQTVYTTKRLLLTILNPSKADIVLNFYNKNKLFLEQHEPERIKNFYTLEFQRANLSCEYNAFIKHSYIRFWIFPKDNTHIPIGSICFSNFLKGAFCSCMLGYKLDKDFCHKGYMHEALEFILPVICNEFNTHRIEAMVMPDNIPSIRLLKKLDFIREGYLHSYAQINGVWQDHLLFTYISNSSQR